jgi:hypothetical protein
MWVTVILVREGRGEGHPRARRRPLTVRACAAGLALWRGARQSVRRQRQSGTAVGGKGRLNFLYVSSMPMTPIMPPVWPQRNVCRLAPYSRPGCVP